jgi:hypothetical protein
MGLSLMQIFNEYIMPAAYEELAQKVEKFNAASNGAIVLTGEGFEGSFYERSFYTSLSSAMRRVNRFGTNNPVASIALAQDKDNFVKVAGGFGPVELEPSQLTWLLKDPAEATVVVSGQFADLLLQDQLNAAIAAAVAAIGNQAGATLDVSATDGISYSGLNSAHAKFGDASQSLAVEIMTGVTYHKLIGQNIANSVDLFTAPNVTVVNILGKPIIVTDAPALLNGTKESILSLSAGGVTIADSGDLITNIETTNGYDRIITTLQSDYTFGLNVKGYRWNGSASPLNAALGTGTNWDLVAQSIKNSAGVILVGDATK